MILPLVMFLTLAQHPCSGGSQPKNDPDCIPAEQWFHMQESCVKGQYFLNGRCITPPPLKCGQYQHEQFTAAHCVSTCSVDGSICTTGCRYVEAEDKCVDDLHTVTEKEWQKLLLRLALLEEKVQR